MLSFAVIFLAFAIVVLIHELGHFAVARLLRFDVQAFQVGFGPSLFRRTDRLGTEWSIRLLPLFGFVRLRTDQDNPRASAIFQRPIWARVLFFLSGPVASIIVGFGLVVWSSGYLGSVVTAPVVTGTSEHASEQGFVVGDRILAIDTTPISEAIQVVRQLDLYDPASGPVKVEVRRGDDIVSLTVDPLPMASPDGAQTHRFGVSFGQTEVAEADVGRAIESLGRALRSLAQADLAGPLGVGASLGQASDGGLVVILFMVGLVSLGMGLINLLPIPVLDGGNIVLCALEYFLGPDRMTKVTQYANILGLSVIIYALIATTIGDLQRLI